MNPEGTEALLNSDTMKEIYSHLRRPVGRGRHRPRLPAGDRSDLDPAFPTGQDRHHAHAGQPPGHRDGMPLDEDIGVTAIAGINGGESTFVGGDSIGVSKDSQHVDQAWNFLSWMLDDEAQVEVVAKDGNVVARTDLADNQYSSADPRLVLFNRSPGKGETPFALNFGADLQRPAGPVDPAVPGGRVRRRRRRARSTS